MVRKPAVAPVIMKPKPAAAMPVPPPVAAPSNGAPDFHRILEQKKSEVMQSLGAQYDNISKLGRVAEEDQALNTHEEFLNVRLNRLDWQRLKQVEEALDRLKAGDYGICQDCEEPIPAKRLQAIPWARFCVPCQERMQEQEKHEEPERVTVSSW